MFYGVPGLGRDIDELAETLRTHIPDGCHLSILGTSGGGIAATQLAERLNAGRLALFSPAFRFKDIAAVSDGAALDSTNALLYFSARHEKDMELADEWRATVLSQSIRLLDTDSHGTLSYVAAAGQLGRLIGSLRGGPPPILS
ncbi:MAG: hypothetical protein U5R46_00525 [Gammaproteobacteria bacterium]|nr:hypothetical protein [Gammaproteobacteria bacterium]